MSRWQQGRIKGDELKCAEWAKETLESRSDGDAHRFCYSMISKGGIIIQVDGMAYSSKEVILVERKSAFTFDYVDEVGLKETNLRELVKMGADNTDVLRDDATGEIKPLQVYLMADRWTANADEQAACLVRMRELGITPLLPQGGDYQVADSCHPWPPSEEEEKRAKTYLRARATRQQ